MSSKCGCLVKGKRECVSVFVSVCLCLCLCLPVCWQAPRSHSGHVRVRECERVLISHRNRFKCIGQSGNQTFVVEIVPNSPAFESRQVSSLSQLTQRTLTLILETCPKT